MKGELLYAYSPVRWRITWTITYAVILLGGILGLYAFSNHIGTHSIPAGSVQLVVPYSKYLVGETISFTVYNHFNSAIYVPNGCPSEPLDVYRWVDGSWLRIHDKAAAAACILESRQVSVPANGSTSGTFAAWPHLFDQPGKYRVVAYVDFYNALPYQDFEVIAKPEPAVPATAPSSSGAQQSSGSTLRSQTVTTSGGSISVEYNASAIYVLSINPAPGYTYERSGYGRQIEITFKSNNEIQVQLSLVSGQLVVHTEGGG